MNKNKIYIYLYYLSFIVLIVPLIYMSLGFRFNDETHNFTSPITFILGIITIILVVIFSYKLKNNKIKNINLIFPISYLIFFIIIMIITLSYNKLLIYPTIQYGYYLNFVLIDNILLSIYSILSLKNS